MYGLIKEWLSERRIIVAITTIFILLLVIILLIFSLLSSPRKSDLANESLGDYYMSNPSELQSNIGSNKNNEELLLESNIEVEKYIFVDIKGAIKSPGVYEITSETRLTDVITMAGGFLTTADQSMVNLSQKLTDQMMITIPTIGVEAEKEDEEASEREEIAPVVVSIPTETKVTEIGKVNLNTADMTQLQTLTGIGEKKAERILEYRQEHGSFKSIDELKEVSGIGDKTFEVLADSISVGID
ncbi:MAG: helix-hairpin-helix domain-containing protein [Carnobacterium sp.]|uniref:helix-hairpin-helix domain-containing protein n=1 Tax=Carnobacterium sp. TaxID=48221 RepID=UPI003C727252